MRRSRSATDPRPSATEHPLRTAQPNKTIQSHSPNLGPACLCSRRNCFANRAGQRTRKPKRTPRSKSTVNGQPTTKRLERASALPTPTAAIIRHRSAILKAVERSTERRVCFTIRSFFMVIRRSVKPAAVSSIRNYYLRRRTGTRAQPPARTSTGARNLRVGSPQQVRVVTIIDSTLIRIIDSPSSKRRAA
jgi:hypothetical protein